MNRVRLHLQRRALALGVLVGFAWLFVLSSSAAATLHVAAKQAQIPSQQAGSSTAPCDDGSWDVVSSPNVGAGHNAIYDVAAISPGNAWAVGSHEDTDGNNVPLILRWDGAEWSVTSPAGGAGTGVLTSVSISAPDAGWAVGYYYPGGTSDGRVLILRWDGSEWRQVAGPGDSVGYLYGVTAVSESEAWAVGQYGGHQAAILRWDGSEWAIAYSLASARTQLIETAFYGVAVAGPGNVWAVGSATEDNGVHSLVIHGDGTNWSRIPSPNFGIEHTYLASVAATEPDDVWMVGYYDTGVSRYEALALRWDGRKWNVVPNPVAGSGPNSKPAQPGYPPGAKAPLKGAPSGQWPAGSYLYDAAISGSDEVWAVGAARTDSPGVEPMILRWDGISWVGDPGVGSMPNSALYGVAVTAGGPQTGARVWAVGAQDLDAVSRTLTMRYQCSSGSQTPTPTPSPLCDNYVYNTGTGTIVPGTTDTGNHCDDCVTNVSLPFPFQLYDGIYNSVHVSSNGLLMFAATTATYINTCLPATTTGIDVSILPHWDDLRTEVSGNCPGGCGIFTSISGDSPNRVFNIEWRAGHFGISGFANFEVRLYEGAPSRFDFVYGQLTQAGRSATVGVQKGLVDFTQYWCNAPGLTDGLKVSFTFEPCGVTPARARIPTSSHGPTTCGITTDH